MRREYSGLIWLQGTVAVIGAMAAYFGVNPLAAKSIMYGGSIALASTIFFAMRYRQGKDKEGLNAEWHLRQAYRVSLERFIWAAVMLATGIKFIELAPLWMLVGFIVGQTTWLFIPIWMRFENTK